MRSLRLLLNPNASVFHLAAVAFEADGTGLGQLERCFEHFAVARAAGGAVLGDDNQLVPILRLIAGLVVRRGAGEGIVAALKLRLAKEDAAVGVGRGAEFELEREV